MAYDVFISHSSKDKAVADAVCGALEANGIRCWIAPRDIQPGESWPAAILRGIAESRMMVLVFSGNSNSSSQVKREVERAANRGIPIAPIRIEKTMPTEDLEYFLSSSHWMDALTQPMERPLKDFAARIGGLLQIGGAVSASPQVPAAIAAVVAVPPMPRPAQSSPPPLMVPARPARRISPLIGIGLGVVAVGVIVVVSLVLYLLLNRNVTNHLAQNPAPATFVAPMQPTAATNGSTVQSLPTTLSAANHLPTSISTHLIAPTTATNSLAVRTTPSSVSILPGGTKVGASDTSTLISTPTTASELPANPLDRPVTTAPQSPAAQTPTVQTARTPVPLPSPPPARAVTVAFAPQQPVPTIPPVTPSLLAAKSTVAFSPPNTAPPVRVTPAPAPEFPSSVQQLLDGADAFRQQGKIAEAIKSLDQAAALQPQSASIRQRRDKALASPVYTNSLGMEFIEMRPPGALAFSIARTDVTRAQFTQFITANNNRPTQAETQQWAYGLTSKGWEMISHGVLSWKSPGFQQADDHPVVCVSLDDAQAFCKWLSDREHRTIRIPTEREWEFAARGGATTVYPWGDLPDLKSCNAAGTADGYPFTSPVETMLPNNYGLYDMVGNVAQWCIDQDPAQIRAEKNARHVVRGGSWAEPVEQCRLTSPHTTFRQLSCYTNIGFRCVMESR